MKKLFIALLFLPLTASAQTLLFKSGFEGVSLGSMSGTAPSSIYQTLSGADSVTGFSWPLTVGSPNSSLTGIHTIPTSGSSGPLATYFNNYIETVTGPNGSPTKALFMMLDGFPDTSCCAQTTLGVAGLTSPPTEQYIRYWVRWPVDLWYQILTNKGSFYRTVFAFKTTTDYRVESYIYGDQNGNPYWYIHGDNNADGRTATYQEYWNVANTSIPVPFYYWSLVEVYFKRSSGSDGRIYWAVDGYTVGDHTGPNMGANNEPILQIMYANVYQNWFPAYEWIDDLEIWSTKPCATLPCGLSQ